ncbi:hypothetical protein FFZ99_06195 [Leptospira interrogans]|uniref:Uncharacterized protein n=3 Tax=Leptospira interrogans TaxID=173 RepID=A0AAQ0AY93_LEPIR|nr:hypothetical protein LIC_12385 [Leptospira interrogans serovar Copenhageni str. Fiocruz L1-130]ARB95099.1 hypothetical protein A6J42_05665 [Leptospira interrogans serovar Copenhageni]ASV10063.1 hypothetical protein B2G50_03020 [Leptospira interrogans serovar Canicola]OMH62704.1 hypothetical protein BW243_17085 [Leptospira interrogans serovar Pomona]QOI35053.1 hypothetical protein LeptoLang_13065 [Leptospira interrogans serovar Icterohaemorrhagiae]QOI37971.1 hypothetical protein Lepto1548_06
MDSETSIKSISGSRGVFRKIFIDLSIESINGFPIFSFLFFYFCIRKEQSQSLIRKLYNKIPNILH